MDEIGSEGREVAQMINSVYCWECRRQGRDGTEQKGGGWEDGRRAGWEDGWMDERIQILEIKKDGNGRNGVVCSVRAQLHTVDFLKREIPQSLSQNSF